MLTSEAGPTHRLRTGPPPDDTQTFCAQAQHQDHALLAPLRKYGVNRTSWSP
jgi:hypothetical protein